MSGFNICTKDDPWDKSKSGRTSHPDAIEVDDSQRDNYPCGDLVDYDCPHCGLRFKVELPQ